MKMRVADFVAQFLDKSGVGHVFMLAGGGMMHLVDAAGRRKNLKCVSNHHEQASALSAESYAKIKGTLGVCYATSGPGATNTVTGIVECWQDSAPVLFVTGQSKLSQTIRGSKLFGLRQFGTFEVDIIPIVQSITKYAVFLDDPNTIRYHLEKACHLALTGRPGPVLIDIPVDVQGSIIETAALEKFTLPQNSESVPNVEVIDKIIHRIKNAKRPLILAGHGIRSANCVQEFRSMVKSINVPVATTPLATDLLAYDNPLYVGHPGMKGDRAGNLAVQCADVILSLGCSLHVLTTGYQLDKFAPQAYKIQVEMDPDILRRENVGVTEKVPCGIHPFLKGIMEQWKNTKGSISVKWEQRCRLWKQELSVFNEPHQHRGGKINYYDLIRVLNDLTVGDETIVTDAGSAFYVVGQAFHTKKNQRVISSGSLGAMGHALPFAIGTGFARPGKKTICVTGDGSFQTNIQELATLKHHNLNVALFVVNNNGYISIRNTQKNFFNSFFVGTGPTDGISFPDLKKISLAYGIRYLKVEKPGELKKTITEALRFKGPVLCEVLTSQDQEIIPTVSSIKRKDGSMESKPLHDMFPFFSTEKLKNLMDFE
jgi:acetolactate synthase-1/2/3 large subunit